jgi:hypothetical protein
MGGPGRVADGGGADSMVRFRLKRRSERCQKMKRRQRDRLDSMGRKCDTAWWCGDVGRRRGDTRKGKEEDDTS